MPHGNGTPTPDEHAGAARAHLYAARTHYQWFDRYADNSMLLAERTQLQALLGIGHALLAVAGQIEAVREGGIYRPEDGR